GSGGRAASLQRRACLREPVPPRAGDGGGGARRHRHTARRARRAARAVAGRMGGLHRGRGSRPRGRSVSRLAPRAARLSAARRRARAVTAVVLALFGGLALLLYGIRLSGDSLQRAAGGRLRWLLTGMARHRLIAVASGAAVTAIIQSSAATTLMLIGFVSAGLMTFRQTLGIILGADIGTTFTVQLIAFKVTDYALLLVGLGFAITFL